MALSPARGGTYTEFCRSETPVEIGLLGNLDSSLLQNGLYDWHPHVFDRRGAMREAKQMCVVDGDLKLGCFSFSLSDFDVPLAGIDVTVIRIYDTGRCGESLAFGHG